MKAVCFNGTCAEDKYVVANTQEINIFFSFCPPQNVKNMMAEILDVGFYVRKKYCKNKLFENYEGVTIQ